MGFLGVVLIVVFIIAAILLVGVVLIQDEQGEGLGGIFGGGSATPFGSRSGNVLTRFTSILGAIFLFCSFGIAWINRGAQSGNVIAAAARQNGSTTTEWWNANVNSNEQLPNTNGVAPLPPIAPVTSQSSSATTTAAKPAAAGPAAPAQASTPAGTSSGAAATPTKAGIP